jgi:hypothetical protein
MSNNCLLAEYVHAGMFLLPMHTGGILTQRPQSTQSCSDVRNCAVDEMMLLEPSTDMCLANIPTEFREYRPSSSGVTTTSDVHSVVGHGLDGPVGIENPLSTPVKTLAGSRGGIIQVSSSSAHAAESPTHFAHILPLPHHSACRSNDEDQRA